MASTHATSVPLMTHEVEQTHHHQTAHNPVNPVNAEPAPIHHETVKQKTPGSSRRGKQYKCGHCHELGHNQKTCPRRASAANEAQSIQPALDAADLFTGVTTTVAPPLVGNGHHPPGPISRVQPAKIDAALEAANRRVSIADTAVANAKTEQEFDDATTQLDSAVRSLEKVAALAHRCAVVAATLQGNWDTHHPPPPIVEREPKRIRLDNANAAAATVPTAPMALNDATAAAAAEAVDTQEHVTNEPKEEHIE